MLAFTGGACPGDYGISKNLNCMHVHVLQKNYKSTVFSRANAPSPPTSVLSVTGRALSHIQTAVYSCNCHLQRVSILCIDNIMEQCRAKWMPRFVWSDHDCFWSVILYQYQPVTLIYSVQKGLRHYFAVVFYSLLRTGYFVNGTLTNGAMLLLC